MERSSQRLLRLRAPLLGRRARLVLLERACTAILPCQLRVATVRALIEQPALQTGYTAYLPISASAVFDRFGQPYDTSRVLDPITLHINTTAYEQYSPLFLPAALTVATGVHFMLASALVIETLLQHGPKLWRQLRSSRIASAHDDDVHGRLMRNYCDVPNWWFGALFLAAISASMIFVSVSARHCVRSSLRLLIGNAAAV